MVGVKLSTKNIENYYVEKLPPQFRPFGPSAFKSFLIARPDSTSSGMFDRFLFEKILEIAQDLFLNFDTKKPTAAGLLRPEYTADNLMRSETARESIRPEIEKVRREVFGNARVPFQTCRAASAALVGELKEDEAKFASTAGSPVKRSARIKEIDETIFNLMRERNAISPVRVFPGSDRMELELFVPAKGKKSKAVLVPCPFGTFPGTRLRKLCEEVKLFARITTFTERAVLFFILADIRPLLVPVKIIPQGPYNTGDLLALYKSLHGGERKRRKLTFGNVEVLKFVRELGGPPNTHIMKFWKSVTEKWNKTHPGREFESRDGLKKAFERAAKKSV